MSREFPVHSYRIKFKVIDPGIATDGTSFGGALTEYILPEQLKDLAVGTILSMDARFLPQGDRIRYNEDIFVET